MRRKTTFRQWKQDRQARKDTKSILINKDINTQRVNCDIKSLDQSILDTSNIYINDATKKRIVARLFIDKTSKLLGPIEVRIINHELAYLTDCDETAKKWTETYNELTFYYKEIGWSHEILETIEEQIGHGICENQDASLYLIEQILWDLVTPDKINDLLTSIVIPLALRGPNYLIQTRALSVIAKACEQRNNLNLDLMVPKIIENIKDQTLDPSVIWMSIMTSYQIILVRPKIQQQFEPYVGDLMVMTINLSKYKDSKWSSFLIGELSHRFKLEAIDKSRVIVSLVELIDIKSKELVYKDLTRSELENFTCWYSAGGSLMLSGDIQSDVIKKNWFEPIILILKWIVLVDKRNVKRPHADQTELHLDQSSFSTCHWLLELAQFLLTANGYHEPTRGRRDEVDFLTRLTMDNDQTDSANPKRWFAETMATAVYLATNWILQQSDHKKVFESKMILKLVHLSIHEWKTIQRIPGCVKELTRAIVSGMYLIPRDQHQFYDKMVYKVLTQAIALARNPYRFRRHLRIAMALGMMKCLIYDAELCFLLAKKKTHILLTILSDLVGNIPDDSDETAIDKNLINYQAHLNEILALKPQSDLELQILKIGRLLNSKLTEKSY